MLCVCHFATPAHGAPYTTTEHRCQALSGVEVFVAWHHPRTHGPRPPHVHGRGVDGVLEMHGVVLLDHVYARAHVLGDVVDVRPTEQSEAGVGVAEAVQRATVPVPIDFEFKLGQ